MRTHARLRRELAIRPLENVERFLSLSIVRDESFPVEAVLDAGQQPVR